MKNLKRISVIALVVLLACLATCFAVNAAEAKAPTADFSEYTDTDGVLSTEDFSAAISARAGIYGGTSDLRIIVIANYELLNANQDANLVVSLGGKTISLGVVDELQVFQEATAAGVTYTAAEGSVITGVVITGVPNDAWTDVTVTLETSTTDYAGEQTYEATITHSVGQKVTLSGSRAIENHQSDFDFKHVLVVWFGQSTGVEGVTREDIVKAGYVYKFRYGDQLYTPTKMNDDGSRLVRLDLTGAGFDCTQLVKGEKYTFEVLMYDTDGNLCYYTGDVAYEDKSKHVILPTEELEKVTVDTETLKSSNIKHWGDGTLLNLFDGDTVNTKMGGDITEATVDGVKVREYTIEFSLTEAATLTYYTLWTCKDTVSYLYRTPLTWILYGEIDGEWVELSNVDTPAREKVNNAPFSYAIDNPQECIKYKMVFNADPNVTYSKNSIGELELFKAADAE